MSNGYVVWQDDTRIGVVTFGSENSKTGPMAQGWTLLKDTHPVDAVRSGADAAVCGTCPFSGGNGCYVIVGLGPAAIWRTWRAGGYEDVSHLTHPQIADLVRVRSYGRGIRLGAYAEPALWPVGLLNALAVAHRRHTGYTHMWPNLPLEYAATLMASVESVEGAQQARAEGWRYYRVTDDPSVLLEREVLCPADRGVQCHDCGLCSGNRRPGAPDVVIGVHGNRGAVRKALQVVS